MSWLYRTADKRFWFTGPDGRTGLKGLHLQDLPLYGSERLRYEPLDVPVVVTEGPKDAQALQRHGLVAVGTMTGAAGVPSVVPLAVLRHRHVVLWPDNDPPGVRHMAAIADALEGVAREVRLVDVAGLRAKAGAADVSRARAVALVAGARPYVRVGRGLEDREERDGEDPVS